MKKKGYYIKKSIKDQSIYINIYLDDFIDYISKQNSNKGWIKFRLYERDIPDDRGFTHNMELIEQQNINKTIPE